MRASRAEPRRRCSRAATSGWLLPDPCSRVCRNTGSCCPVFPHCWVSQSPRASAPISCTDRSCLVALILIALGKGVSRTQEPNDQLTLHLDGHSQARASVPGVRGPPASPPALGWRAYLKLSCWHVYMWTCLLWRW